MDYDGVSLCLRTAATNGLIALPPCDMWARRAIVMMMPAGDNSWLVHQCSLAVIPEDISGASRRNGQRSENFAYQYRKYLKWSLTCYKILRHGTSGFTSHPKEGVLRIFIALKNVSPRPGLNPRPLEPHRYSTNSNPAFVKTASVKLVAEREFIHKIRAKCNFNIFKYHLRVEVRIRCTKTRMTNESEWNNFCCHHISLFADQ
jgi:hypothetical protein